MQRILVTGGNAGIGKALCKQLASENGCFVYMTSRSPERGAEALASIIAEAPACEGKIEVIKMDVQQEDSVKQAAQEVQEKLGAEKLFAIVNNAGAGLAHGIEAKQVVDTNVYGPKRVCDAFVPLMVESGGRIVNVGSGIGPGWMSRAAPGVRAVLCNPSGVTWEQIDQVVQADIAEKPSDAMNAYGISKAALMSITMLLARTLPGTLCSTISPGFIATEMTKGFNAKLTPEQGTVSIRHCLFGALEGSGWMYGSDGKRSPIDASREPSDPVYTDPTGRGW